MQLRCELPKYAAPLFQPKRYKVLWGGRGKGASWSFARALLIMGAQRPLRVLCARELQRSIKDSVHRLLSDQIEALGLVGYIITNTEIRHTNGTLFLFEGLRYNINKIKSLEGVDVCWVEEAESVSKDSWETLIPTIRKEGSEIWITFNPDQEDDPTYQRFVVDPPPNAWVKKVSWRDNPWFPDTLREEKDYLYGVDPDAAEHVWEGETKKASDAQILHGKWIVESFEPGSDWDGPYHGLDFGFANDPTVLVQCWIHKRKLYIEKEAYKVGLELDHTREFLQRQVPNVDKYVVRADASRPESISYLKRHGIPRIIAAVKWPGSIEDGIAHLRQYEQIVIHPRCVHAKEEAKLYSYKVDERTGDILPIIVDKHNNVWDAVRYALAPIIRAVKIPRSGYGGMSYQNT